MLTRVQRHHYILSRITSRSRERSVIWLPQTLKNGTYSLNLRLHYSSKPSDSYEDFKRSFMEPTDYYGDNTTGNSKHSMMRNQSDSQSLPSLDTISNEVLSVMLDETIRRHDGETLRMLLIESKVLGKLNQELLQDIFEKCFQSTNARGSGSDTSTGSGGDTVTIQQMLSVEGGEYAMRSNMENASFILQTSLSLPPATSVAAAVTGAASSASISASSIHCSILLDWAISHEKWYQSAIIAQYMIQAGYTFNGDREIYYIFSGLMKNNLGITRAIKLLEIIVKNKRSDLSELFSYTKINRFSLSKGKYNNNNNNNNNSYSYGGGNVLDTIPLKSLSTALLSQLREQWFSFGASKTLIALSCGSNNHEIAIDYVHNAMAIVDKNHNNYGIDDNENSSSFAGGRLRRLASLISKSFMNNNNNNNDDANANTNASTNANTNVNSSPISNSKGVSNRHGSSSKVDILSMLRAFSQGSAIVNSSNDTEMNPLDQVLIDISVKYMNAQTRANILQNTNRIKVNGQTPISNSDMNSENNDTAVPFLSGPLKHSDFMKMLWVLCYRVRKHGNQHPISSGGVLPKASNTALESQSISDSYPRITYDNSQIDDNHNHNNNKNDDSHNQNTTTTNTNTNSSSALVTNDIYLQTSYNQLNSFLRDDGSDVMTSSPAPGYHRRTFRYLCDELGLRHKIVELLQEKTGGVGDTYGVRVWKDDSNNRHDIPPSLYDILKKDGRKRHQFQRYDGYPQHWNRIEEYLSTLTTSTLTSVCDDTIASLAKGYPSAEWGLLLAQTMKDKNKSSTPLSSSFIRNLIKMAGNRSDIYGLLEGLYANQEAMKQTVIDNDHSHKNSNNHKNKKIPIIISDDGFIYTEDEARAAGITTLKTMSERHADDEMMRELHGHEYEYEYEYEYEHEHGNGNKAYNNVIPKQFNYMRPKDWNRVCQTAFNCRLSELSQPSFREAYTEVMNLMNQAGVELEDVTMRQLLRFLIHTDPNSSLCKRIINKLAMDKKNKNITFIECSTLTYLICKRLQKLLPGYQIGSIELARPIYKSENYLFVYPAALKFMVDSVVANAEVLGSDFLIRFEAAWARAHSDQGRNQLYILLEEYLAIDSDSRKSLIQHVTDNEERKGTSAITNNGNGAQGCILMLTAYVSYLVSINGGSVVGGKGIGTQGQDSYRRAYDLLYAAESMMDEAEEYKRSLSESRGKGRTSGSARGRDQYEHFENEHEDEEEGYEDDNYEHSYKGRR
jgi:hypothetical protein